MVVDCPMGWGENSCSLTTCRTGQVAETSVDRGANAEAVYSLGKLCSVLRHFHFPGADQERQETVLLPSPRTG